MAHAMPSLKLPPDFPFELGSSGLSWPVIQGCACTSYLAYRPATEIDTHFRRWGMSVQIVDVSHYDVQALLIGGDGFALVTFRGTQPTVPRDWLDDLAIAHVPGPFGGRVHDGFSSCVHSAWEAVSKFGRQAVADGHELWLSGHSLGAAMATLAAARFIEDGVTVTGVANFGAPRAGDAQFADTLDKHLGDKIWRVVNNADIVTRVAPREFGYRHAGRLVHFDANGRVEKVAGSWERFLNRLSGPFADLAQWGAVGFEDHSVVRYVELSLSVDE
jgi:triacylglycerol lipase